MKGTETEHGMDAKAKTKTKPMEENESNFMIVLGSVKC